MGIGRDSGVGRMGRSGRWCKAGCRGRGSSKLARSKIQNSRKRNTAALRENEEWNRGESNQVKPSEDVEAAMVKPRPDVESGAAAGGDTRAPGSGHATGDGAAPRGKDPPGLTGGIVKHSLTS